MSSRKVVKPTVDHCRSIIERDNIAIPLREYYNWFLIKYGAILDGKIVNEGDRVGFRHIVRYTLWCERFLKENKHD